MSLLLIMGLPAAGKTTLCSKITERLPNAIVFSLDDVNGRWSDEFRAHTDRKSFEHMRRPFERMARAFGLRYCCVLVDCDVQDALHRNSSRGENRVSDETILKMDREMEVPADALLHRYQGVEEILQRVNGLRMKRVQSSKRSPSESSRWPNTCFCQESCSEQVPTI
ncbi:hypothetical protein RB195_001588 [Necator americanus]|uniref:Chromatin associated protein KTI12 n=1 Tax=Necator americanus TaxID=51031 RepID=A0ABR1DHZ5_NECAM